jgi:hypothetical protein
LEIGFSAWSAIGLASLASSAVVAGGGAAPPVAPQAKDKGTQRTDAVRELTATIDRLIAAKWAQEKVTPASPAGDAEFLRRVSLDLGGKIPTVAEARAFIDDPAPAKRLQLVERLLDGPSFVNHFTTTWRALLLPEIDDDIPIRLLAPAFEGWLREKIRTNARYDTMVRELVAFPLAANNGRTTLNLFQQRNKPSPAAYYMAKGAKPENLAAAAARTFLGVRIECAQCHDHPSARWKREEFWELAAFFGGVERPGPADGFGPLREVPDRRELMIPGTERVVQARFLGGGEPPLKYKVSPRTTLAEWMTAAENPYFARAAVNRLWAHLFGVGLVDPVDDMDDKTPSHPELLDELARQFTQRGYDIKFVISAVTASRAYQLSSASDTTPSEPQLFARMSVKGLTGEQLYDSLTAATGLNARDRPVNLFLGQLTPRGQFLQKFARKGERPTEPSTSILQALALMNGQVIADATNVDKGALLGAVADAPFLDTAGRVEAVYLATLTRRPSPEESARLVEYVARGGPAGDPKQALADVFWALLNSPEFLLNH